MEGEFNHSSEKKPYYLRDRTMPELLSIAQATSLITVLNEILAIAYDRDERKSEPLHEIARLVVVAQRKIDALQAEHDFAETLSMSIKDEVEREKVINERKKVLDFAFFDDNNPRREARVNKIIDLFIDEQ